MLAITGACPNGLWCGNPVTDENKKEPYVFLDFYDDSGLGFERVIFFEMPTVAGYESDDHTVGYYNTVGGTAISAPEPTTLALVGLALAGLSGVRHHEQ